MENDRYIGRLLDNRYEILEIIGTGGMAVVYKARCHRLNRLVAIKILKDEYSRDEEFRRRFHAEGEAVAMLSHPNIVQVYDVSSTDNADYIVMELIDGITLKQYMEKKGVLNWKETLHFAMQIAKALEHAHGRGIVHRDIKPHNVMVLKNGSVKVTDFGIARVVSKSNTLTKEALGSVHYISPEQAKGGRVDNRSDIYSLGVVMYELMTGRPPYDGESPVSVAIQHINGGAVMPSTLNPNIPGGLEQIIMKAMALDPKERYASATAMLYDMDEFRKDPTILFDFGDSAVDAATQILNTAEVARNSAPLPPKNTAERVAGGSQQLYRPAEQYRGSNTGRVQQPKRRPAPIEEEEIDNRSRVATIAIVACSVVAVIALGIFLWLLLNGGSSGQDEKLVEVPKLLGQMYDDLPDYPDFKIVVQKSEYSSEYSKGQICYQNPEAGEKVVPGTIVVIVSMGEEPQTPTMADVVNMDGDQAVAFLKGLEDLKLQVLPKQEYNETVKEGWVIRTDPAANEELTVGQTVYVYISMGQEIITAKMPNLLGQTQERATELMDASGFTNYEFVPVDSDTVEIGKVVSQSEERNTEVDITALITIEVSSGPKKGIVPYVVGMDAEEAQKTLYDMGFTKTDIKPVESNAPVGQVIDQSEAAETEVELSKTITLIVSSGPAETTGPNMEEVEKVISIDLSGVTKETTYVLTIELNGELYGEGVPIQPGTASINVMLVGSGIQKYKLYVDGEYYKTIYVDFTE